MLFVAVKPPVFSEEAARKAGRTQRETDSDASRSRFGNEKRIKSQGIGARGVRDDAERGVPGGMEFPQVGRVVWWFHTDWTGLLLIRANKPGKMMGMGVNQKQQRVSVKGKYIYTCINTKNDEDSGLTSPPKNKRVEFESQTNEGTF